MKLAGFDWIKALAIWRQSGTGIVNSSKVRLMAFAFDLGLALLAMFLALLLRLGDFDDMGKRNLVLGALVPFATAAGIGFILMRTYRTSWRHASTSDLTNIVYAVSIGVLLYYPLSFAVTRLSHIPRTSIVMAWMMLVLMMGGSRVAYRMFKEGSLFLARKPMLSHQLPILIVGGGVEGELLIRGLQASSEYYPVGILDDGAVGSVIRGVPVLGTIAEVERVVEGFADAGDRPRKLVVASRSLPGSTLDHLVEVSNRLGLTVARGPDPTRFRPGASDAPELQPISVEDLLGRPQIVLDPGPVQRLVTGKRVLVTGAGGSIGSEIVRQVCAIGPAAVCLVDASEFNLYTIDGELAEQWPDIERVASVIDVRHRTRLNQCFAAFGPDIVFHAAALKHVPLVEANPVEGIWTNAIGSRNVCDAAICSNCKAMVLISTDKAVNPANVMGATKRAAESYCQALALEHEGDRTRFVAVRFGNVLGSTGSVVPLFERQLKAGGPLTVTHPAIERYFMTIREAVQLVLQASALGVEEPATAGRVFVLDMGQPVKIVDLARQMIRLAGREPDKDVMIRYTGLRPGEKLYEELFHGGEKIEPTSTARINVAAPRTAGWDEILIRFEALELACLAGDERAALRALLALVPEYVADEAATVSMAMGGLNYVRNSQAAE